MFDRVYFISIRDLMSDFDFELASLKFITDVVKGLLI